MKKRITLFIFFILMASNFSFSNSLVKLKSESAMPLVGTYSIPGDFATINDAVIALNSFGVSGSVVFNVQAGHNEIAPAGVSIASPGGISLGVISGVSSTNTITFQKSGNGINPKVTAGLNHFSGCIMDAVIKFVGADFVTFDGIDVAENPLNTTSVIASNNMTEFGYAFFKVSNTDGSQNNVIKNSTITLNNGATNYQNTIGIFSTAVTTSINGLLVAAATTFAGSNSNNLLLNNIVSNANIGIAVIGSNTVAAMDSNWIIDGNTINNFGFGNGVAMSAYQKLGTSVQGVLINQNQNFTIQNNTISSVNGTMTTSTSLVGIVMGWSGTMVQPTSTYSNIINNNTITINQNFSENSYGIWSRIGNASSRNSFENNIITLTNNSSTAVASKFSKGIFQDILIGEFICTNNSISIDYEGVDHAHAVTFIQSDVATSIKRKIENNTLFTPSGKSLKTSGAVYGITHSGLSSGELSISNNSISIDKGNVSSASIFSGIYSVQSSVAEPYSINENEIYLINSSTTNAATVISGIFNNDGTSTTNKLFSDNIITINGTNIGGTTHGIYVAKSGIAIVTDNEIEIDNYSPTNNGIFFTTGSTANIISTNKVTFLADEIPIACRINGINNDVGQGTISGNELILNPTSTSVASTNLTVHGINSTKPNVVIENNSVEINSTTPWLATTNGIYNTGSNAQISNNSLIKCYSISTGTGNVIVNGINNFTGSSNSIIDSNTGIDVFSSANSGTATVIGISNAGLDSTLSNNNGIKVNSFSGGAANARGISNSGSGAQVIHNNLMEISAFAATTSATFGILNSGVASLIAQNNSNDVVSNSLGSCSVQGISSAAQDTVVQSNDSLTVTGNAVANALVYGINNTAINSQILGNSNIDISSTSSTLTTNARGIYSSEVTEIRNNENISVSANAATTSASHGILSSGIIENNSVSVNSNSQIGIQASSGIQSGADAVIADNTILTNMLTSEGNAFGYGINSTGGNSIIDNNTIDHTVASAGNQATLEWYAGIFGIRSTGDGTLLQNNKILKVNGSMGRGTTYFEIAGIFLENANNPIVENNLISTISSNGTANNRTYLAGIYAIGTTYNALIKNNRIFNVYFNNNVNTLHPDYGTDIPAITNGIWIRLYDNQTLNNYTIVNNTISKLYHGNSSKVGAVFGMTLSTKNINYKVYHNTILIGDNTTQITSNTSGNFGGSALGFVNRLGSGKLDLRNNILYANLLPRGTGYTSALAAIKSHDAIFSDFFTNPGQTGVRPSSYETTSNNNLFYAPSVHNRRSYIYCEGDGFGTEYNRFNIDHNVTAVNDPNFNVSPTFSGCTSKFKTLMAGSDSNSFYQNVSLVEGVGDQEGIWTPVGETFAELGAQFINASFDLDYNNVSRGTSIDMGAIQFAGEAAAPPAISYMPLSLTGGCGSVVSTLTLSDVQITDEYGILTTGAFVPRLYYKINSGSYTSVAGTLTSGDGNNGLWSFTLTGLTAGTISYYVIAQDRLSRIISSPSAGLVACNVNSVNTHPTSPNTLSIGGVSSVYSSSSWNVVPDIGKATIFEDDFDSIGDIDACSVLVKAGNVVTIKAGHTLTVQNEVVVETGGELIFENNASLVQISEAANSGQIKYIRNASIRKLDYVYWSSPVKGENGTSGFNLNNLAQNPLVIPGPKYKWSTLLNNNNGDGGITSQGTWINASGNLMESGRGYIVRAPSSFSSTVTETFTAQFEGVPFNGELDYPIQRGDYTGADYTGLNGQTITNMDDNWNLLGNPYPSAISASKFIFDNSPANGGHITGGVRIWTHGSLPSSANQNPFYGSFGYNYTSNDYIIYTWLGSTCCPATEDDFLIAAGQSFFVQMVDGATGSATANFNNQMRSKVFDNDNFYRYANANESNSIEKHRFWLDIVDANQLTDRTLIGYAEGATYEIDDLFDAQTKAINGSLQIYSLVDDFKTSVQARPIPFDDLDEVSIGATFPSNGNYTIVIGGVDGLFDNTTIYLKDELLNVVHNLINQPYHFTSNSGSYNDRFKIIYQNTTLSTPEFSKNQVLIVSKNKQIEIKSMSDLISEIQIYDMIGRLLYSNDSVNKEEIIIDSVSNAEQTLIIKVKTTENYTITQKIIH